MIGQVESSTRDKLDRHESSARDKLDRHASSPRDNQQAKHISSAY